MSWSLSPVKQPTAHVRKDLLQLMRQLIGCANYHGTLVVAKGFKPARLRVVEILAALGVAALAGAMR
jgi:hypothetical protein